MLFRHKESDRRVTERHFCVKHSIPVLSEESSISRASPFLVCLLLSKQSFSKALYTTKVVPATLLDNNNKLFFSFKFSNIYKNKFGHMESILNKKKIQLSHDTK